MSRQLYTILFTLGIVLSSQGMQLPDDITNTTSNFDEQSPIKKEAEDLFHTIDRELMKQSGYALSPAPQRRAEIQINAYVNDKRVRITNQDNTGRTIGTTMVITPSLSVFNSKLYPNGALAPIPANESYFELMVKSDNKNLSADVGALAESVAQQERLITNEKLFDEAGRTNIDLLKKIRLYDLYLLTGALRNEGKSLELTGRGIRALQNILKPTHEAWKKDYDDSYNSGYTELMLALKYRKDNNIDQKDDTRDVYTITAKKR